MAEIVEAGPETLGIVGGRPAVPQHQAGGRRQQAGQAAQQRRLAAAVAPPQQRCAAGRDGEVEVGEDQALAATAGQGANREHGVIPGDRGRRDYLMPRRGEPLA